jgi:hypothetical protein
MGLGVRGRGIGDSLLLLDMGVIHVLCELTVGKLGG